MWILRTHKIWRKLIEIQLTTLKFEEIGFKKCVRHTLGIAEGIVVNIISFYNNISAVFVKRMIPRSSICMENRNKSIQ